MNGKNSLNSLPPRTLQTQCVRIFLLALLLLIGSGLNNQAHAAILSVSKVKLTPLAGGNDHVTFKWTATADKPGTSSVTVYLVIDSVFDAQGNPVK